MSLRQSEECLKEADAAFEAGDYHTARQAYYHHIFWRTDSTGPSLDVLLKIGHCHGQLGNHEQAYTTLGGVAEEGGHVYKGLANVALARAALSELHRGPSDLTRMQNLGDHAAEHLGRAIKCLRLISDEIAQHRLQERLE